MTMKLCRRAKVGEDKPLGTFAYGGAGHGAMRGERITLTFKPEDEKAHAHEVFGDRAAAMALAAALVRAVAGLDSMLEEHRLRQEPGSRFGSWDERRARESAAQAAALEELRRLVEASRP